MRPMREFLHGGCTQRVQHPRMGWVSLQAVVPCNARLYVNSLTRKYMRFEALGRKYSVDLLKGPQRTIISGGGWKKFTSDNNLGGGDLVLFDMQSTPRKGYVCMLADDFFDTHQPPVNDVMGGAAPVNDIIAGDAHWSDEDEDDDGLVVEFTRGVVLNTREEEKVNKLVEELKEDFLGRPFVHRLTTSNVDAGNMKCPTGLLSVWEFQKKEWLVSV